ENIGGLVSPVILDIRYADGKKSTLEIPAEIWKRNTKTIKKLVIAKKEITKIEIDPMLETADTDRNNNYWPPRPIESRFQMQKRKKEKNPMQKAKDEENRSKKQKNEKKKKSSEKDSQ
ncbi:MAG: aminopeptidase, partial [Verrucomicrobiales bacterium]